MGRTVKQGISEQYPGVAAAIVVRTANRPEILDRCIRAAIEGCGVARQAVWIVLDDSSSSDLRASNREVARCFRSLGLQLNYLDSAIEREIVCSLPSQMLQRSFERLVARHPSCPTEGGRNLALVTGLSFEPRVLFLIDDDIVVHHEQNCFFHWCMSVEREGSLIAAPSELGISDMTYLERLNSVLRRDEWDCFVSDDGFRASEESWFSATNPLWKNKRDAGENSGADFKEKEVLNGQIIALRGEVDWVAFPHEYNADLNWSLLQAAIHRTALIRVAGVNVQHLPPRIGHPGAEAIVSELVGTAITGALRQVAPRGEEIMSTLADHFSDALQVHLKKGLMLFLAVERAIRLRADKRAYGVDSSAKLAGIKSALADAAEQLKAIDAGTTATLWLGDFEDRCRMLSALRRSRTAQSRIRRTLARAAA